LENNGIDVIIDDRDERPGVKFKDADLIGFPLRVVIGEKTLASDQVEIKLRNSSELIFEKIGKAYETILKLIKDKGQNR